MTVGTFDAVAGRAPSDADVELELRKWQQAQAFCNLTHQIDFAYDGVFWQADVDEFCSTMQITVPDIIFVGECTRKHNRQYAFIRILCYADSVVSSLN